MEDEYEEERMLLSQQQNNDLGRRSRGTTQGTQPSYSGTDSFSLYEAMKSGASNFNSWKDYLNLDPWAVFEDFFFQESTVRNDQGSNQEFYSSEQAYGNKRYHQSQTTQMKPPRVSEQTIYRGFDPSYGANIYTVLRREDYIHDERDSDGKYFYQILGQDFISGEMFNMSELTSSGSLLLTNVVKYRHSSRPIHRVHPSGVLLSCHRTLLSGERIQ